MDSLWVWEGVGPSNTTSFSLMVDIDQALQGAKAEPFIRDERALDLSEKLKDFGLYLISVDYKDFSPLLDE